MQISASVALAITIVAVSRTVIAVRKRQHRTPSSQEGASCSGLPRHFRGSQLTAVRVAQRGLVTCDYGTRGFVIADGTWWRNVASSFAGGTRLRNEVSSSKHAFIARETIYFTNSVFSQGASSWIATPVSWLVVAVRDYARLYRP